MGTSELYPHFIVVISRSSYDTFTLVVNFINQNWVPCHIIVGLFETPNTFGVLVLAKHVKVLNIGII
jgi:hypothetical protein